MRIKFDSGPSGAGSDFRAPTEIITAQTITELVPALEQLEAAQRGAMVSGLLDMPPMSWAICSSRG